MCGLSPAYRIYLTPGSGTQRKQTYYICGMLDTITSPTLLIDKAKVLRNVAAMADRAHRHGLALRPHFKTHQSRTVGEWMRPYGIDEISVTSLRMARDFAAHGWPKITIAMPANRREFQQINALNRVSEISLFLTDPDTAAVLAEEISVPLSYFIELDAGYGRSGVHIKDLETVSAVINAAGNHRFRGFYVHSGHTYDAGEPEDIRRVHNELLLSIRSLQAALREEAGKLPEGSARDYFMEPSEIAIGDTPACSTQEAFTGVTSIGPGNFVYYDLVQAGLGACSTDDIAVCLAAPIVQVIPKRGEAIVHAGWVQLGKDKLPDGTHGRLVRLLDNGKWTNPIPGAAVVKLSQEHGTLSIPNSELAKLRPGDLIGIMPVHACALVHGMRATGEERVISG